MLLTALLGKNLKIRNNNIYRHTVSSIQTGIYLIKNLKDIWFGLGDLALILGKVDDGDELNVEEQMIFDLFKECVEEGGGKVEIGSEYKDKK